MTAATVVVLLAVVWAVLVALTWAYGNLICFSVRERLRVELRDWLPFAALVFSCGLLTWLLWHLAHGWVAL